MTLYDIFRFNVLKIGKGRAHVDVAPSDCII